MVLLRRMQPKKPSQPTRFEDETASGESSLPNLTLVFDPALQVPGAWNRYLIQSDGELVGRLEAPGEWAVLAMLVAASPDLVKLLKRCYPFLEVAGGGGKETDLRYDIYWALWGRPDEPRHCLLHRQAEVVDCRADECRGRYLCLGPEPHHLDYAPPADDLVVAASDSRSIQRRLFLRLEEWFHRHADLPRMPGIYCPVCRHEVAVRWRSAGDAIKITCFACGLQVDVARATSWGRP